MGISVPPTSPWEPSVAKQGSPTSYFRENLRNDTFYITSWANAGLTNEFLSYIHLIYLGYISNRVPIVPPFVPDEHIPWTAGSLQFGSVFNLTRVRSHLRLPVLDWSDVKTLPSLSSPEHSYLNPNVEAIGCWSTRVRTEPNPINAQNTERLLGLDVSYTRVPQFTRLYPHDAGDSNVVFHGLSATITPNHPFESPETYPLMSASPSGSRLAPDEHLSCYDFLYYATSGVSDLEWRFRWSPSWRQVGTHLHFTDDLVALAREYVRRAFGHPPNQPLPPLITVHIRRGDFVNQCWDGRPCLIETEKFAQAVAAIQQELSDYKGIDVSHVLVSSDETDPEFWKNMTAYGWNFIDHSKEMTSVRFGDWYPPLIDQVALTFGAGFVGTDRSTFSALAGWRTEDWNDGISRLVTRED
ncbi:hypothetical protein FA15DRAFT_703919 [Coprinopsis marcescibilis]|uniref:GDP-fucose protein O-fucosyltransferase n=1 Tax=Coprinopsis marcescibilis TaxID=230819 RepID=A0A5C3KYG1_COPMA|nr:hypothetical protein FA15DRAFT_703919 [Coprinopsis marcescibilis]